MSSNLTLFSAGAANEKDYIGARAPGQDVTTSPLSPLHTFYLSNDHQVAVSHANHQLYHQLAANRGQHREGSHHLDQLTSLALLHNELLQGSDACIDEHSAGSDLSSEAAFTAGGASRPAWTMNAEEVLPSQAAEYNRYTGSMLALQGAAAIHRGTTMNMEDSRKTIDLCPEGLDVEGAGAISESINIGNYVGIINPERGINHFVNSQSDANVSNGFFQSLSAANSNAHNLQEQKQQVQSGDELPYILAGRHGETMRRSTSSPYGFSADQYNPRGNSSASDLELQHMSSINAGDNMMNPKLYEIEARQSESTSTLVYGTPRNICMGNNVMLCDVKKGSARGSTECGYIPLTVNQNGDQQAMNGNEWENTENMAIARSAAATKELLRLSSSEQAINAALIRPRNFSSIMYSSAASNSHNACVAEASARVNDMNPLDLLVHRSSLHDHSPLNAAPPADLGHRSEQQPRGGRHDQFDIAACSKLSTPLARWDNHNELNNRNHNIATMSSSLNQETPTANYTAPMSGTSTFLNYLGNLHQKTSSPDAGLSLYLQSGTPAQHNMNRCSDLLSLDFTYSRTGSGDVLRSSKYMRAAQQLLEEFCNLKPHSTGAPYSATTCAQSLAEQHRPVDPAQVPNKQQLISAEERCQLQMRKARLIGMVEELDRRYQQYREQMQLIVTSYESATGMGAAAPYTALARRLISRQFRALRDTIAEHIQAACRSLGEDISSVPVLSKGETPRLRILDQRIRHHRTLQQVGIMSQQHQVWRPQRGLPERSVSVLRAWLFEHFLHPYPKDSEKLMLARLTGLTRNQVANWFINARVRLWKPMVEQMYTEERKEAESQSGAPAGQDSGRSITAYASSHGNITGMAQEMHVEYTRDGQCCPKSHHYQHLAHGESNPSCTSHHSIMTKEGVSLTLALQQSSSAELAQSTYNPNHYYHLQPACAEANYNITNAFS